eukprot:340539-Rhodomonas_salina.3
MDDCWQCHGKVLSVVASAARERVLLCEPSLLTVPHARYCSLLTVMGSLVTAKRVKSSLLTPRCSARSLLTPICCPSLLTAHCSLIRHMLTAHS